MQRFQIKRIIITVGFLVLVSAAASAQSTTLRVLRSAVVVEAPAGDADVVGTVVAGELLEPLDQNGSWYLVRPPDGTQREWRTGWINGAMVEIVSTAVTRRPPATQVPSQPRPTTRPPTRLRTELYSYPGVETSVGWDLVNDGTLTSPLGFNVAVSNNFTSWFGVTTDIAANFFSLDAFGREILDSQLYTVAAGPKFTLRAADRVAPYVQLLAGTTYVRGILLGVERDGWFFTMQPGGGIDFVVTDEFGIRLGVDSRVRFFSGMTDKDFRLMAGFTLRSSFR